MTNVKIGQVWEDLDVRRLGRTFRIDNIVYDVKAGVQVAIYAVLTNSTVVQGQLDAGEKWAVDRRIRPGHLHVDRLTRKRNGGYRLVSDS